MKPTQYKSNQSLSLHYLQTLSKMNPLSLFIDFLHKWHWKWDPFDVCKSLVLLKHLCWQIRSVLEDMRHTPALTLSCRISICWWERLQIYYGLKSFEVLVPHKISTGKDRHKHYLNQSRSKCWMFGVRKPERKKHQRIWGDGISNREEDRAVLTRWRCECVHSDVNIICTFHKFIQTWIPLFV